jgi:hypothetical protein
MEEQKQRRKYVKRTTLNRIAYKIGITKALKETEDKNLW